MLFKQFFQAISTICAFLFVSLKNGGHGVNVSGLGLTMIGSSYIAVYNSPDIWAVFSPIAAFTVPFIIYFKEWGWEEVYEAAVINVRSPILVFYNAAFILSSLTHTVVAWCSLPKEHNKRGTSHIYRLVKHVFAKTRIPVGEFFINLLECFAVIGLGVYLVYYKIDVYAGWFFITIAANELVILQTDKSAQLIDQPLFDL